MTYYGPKEMAAAFRTVRGNTIKIAEEIPEDRYSFRATPETRSVGETLVHIAVMPRVPTKIHFQEHFSSLAGFDFFGMMGSLQAEVKKPRSKAEILELLRSEGDAFASLLEGASEGFLAEQVRYPEPMTPPVKSRFEMLIAAKEHEMHHRGQLMVMQRMIGQKPHLTRQMEERVAAMQSQASKASGD
jgi:uncharacterized damage-inducible protein DinB